ncbi:MAG TPA: hypothetical protein PKI11_01500 [Candidatus Hydrogenedentes bacterium]|nr:hypothetical protein [Candidatus Hydrogenedentota bacterium]
MRSRSWVVYFFVPLGVSLVLLAMYFLDGMVLQRLVSPKLPPLSPDTWREFGLLENLQNALLLGMAVTAFVGALRFTHPLERLFFWTVFAGAVFVFLEEVDYGMHLIAYWRHRDRIVWFKPMDEHIRETVGSFRRMKWYTFWAHLPRLLAEEFHLADEPFNLHNIGNATRRIKAAADLLIALLFVVVPLAAPKLKNPWIARFAPSRYAILTVLAIVLLRYATHGLGALEKLAYVKALEAGQVPREFGSISNNLSEFRELNVYYLFAVYLLDIVRRHSRVASSAEAAPA